MNDKNFSEEFINAFADDQLAPEEKSRVYPIINDDPELNRRVCEVRKIRDLIQLAYKEPPAAPPRRTGVASGRGRHAAAVLILAAGTSLGWGLHEALPKYWSGETGVPAETRPATATAQKGEMRIVLHLSRGGVEQMRDVLDAAESLLQHYAKIGQPVRINLIANGDGLNLLRADTSPFAARISDIRRKHGNITFAACQNTIDRLQSDYGLQAQLLPEAVVIDSGVAQIILLQQQGWAYIQV